MTVLDHEHHEHEHEHGHVEELVPIDVRIVREPQEQSAAADLSSWQTYVLVGTEAPFRLLAQDKKRHKANILINGTAGDFIVLGKPNQMSNKQGGRLYVGNFLPVESAAEVWVLPQATTSTNPIVITVEEERYL